MASFITYGREIAATSSEVTTYSITVSVYSTETSSWTALVRTVLLPEWQYRPVISVPVRLKQEEHSDLEGSLSYIDPTPKHTVFN